jgi:hypothetical protein
MVKVFMFYEFISLIKYKIKNRNIIECIFLIQFKIFKEKT